ncbi:hypothetical protein D3C75_1125270 [compost metagenome]
MNLAQLNILGNAAPVDVFLRSFLLQLFSHILKLPAQFLISGPDIGIRIPVLDMQVAYQENLLFHMIEYDNAVAEHEADIIHIQVIDCVGGKLLIILQQIISEESDGPACKRRHPVQLRTAV